MRLSQPSPVDNACLPLRISLTLPEASEHAARDPSGARFGAALAVSVLVHLTTLAAFGDAIGGARSGAFSWSARIDRPLELALSPPRVAAETEPRNAAVQAVSAAKFSVAQPVAPPQSAPTVALQRAAERVPERGGMGHGLMPHVIVNDRVPRARFGDALDDALGEFPVEIDAAVVLPGKLEVPYPPAALAARRQDTVLVYAVIDPQGVVEETRVVEGTPEFAAAVEAALATMRFVPAHDHGQNIRFYVTLEFAFRIEGAGVTSDAPAATAEIR